MKWYLRNELLYGWPHADLPHVGQYKRKRVAMSGDYCIEPDARDSRVRLTWYPALLSKPVMLAASPVYAESCPLQGDWQPVLACGL